MLRFSQMQATEMLNAYMFLPEVELFTFLECVYTACIVL